MAERKFDRRVAPRLKKAIKESNALKLVKSFPQGRMIAFTSGLGSGGVYHMAEFPGELLLVGFVQPTYLPDPINQGIKEVYEKVNVGHNTASYSPAQIEWSNSGHKIRFGALDYTEEFPGTDIIVYNHTDILLSPPNPVLQNILDKQCLTETNSHHVLPTRQTRVVFFPSLLTAKLAGGLKETYNRNPFRASVKRAIFGLIETVDMEDYKLLLDAETLPRDKQRLAVQSVAAKYISVLPVDAAPVI